MGALAYLNFIRCKPKKRENSTEITEGFSDWHSEIAFALNVVLGGENTEAKLNLINVSG